MPFSGLSTAQSLAQSAVRSAGSVRATLKHRPQLRVALLIFLASALIYALNGQVITSNDNVPNSILALNWLDNGTLTFDNFRDGYRYEHSGKIPYYFVEAPNGHLSSTYPIGAAIVTFPIYFMLFWLVRSVECLQSLLTGSPVDLIDLTARSANGTIYSLQKVVVTLTGALTITLFYLITRLKFRPAVALISTFVFGFATTSWMIGSQGLWQHGISNLVVLSILFCLLKATRTTGPQRRQLLVLVGFFCGLLPGIRPTSLAFSGVAIAYSLLIFRREALVLCWGLPSILLSAGWNFYYFGFALKYLFVGGYSRFAAEGNSFVQSYYVWTARQFWTGFVGHLFSPSRGLLIFSPVLVFTIPGAYRLWQARAGKDEKLLLGMTLAAGVIFLQYCFFRIWAGGWCYGPRYMTDLLPVLGLLLAYFLAAWLDQPTRPDIDQGRPWPSRTSRRKGMLALFLILLIWSTFTQAVGAFGSNNWDGIPTSTIERVWRWQDSQIERHARHVWFKLTNPIKDADAYLKQFGGRVEAVRRGDQTRDQTRSPASGLSVTSGKNVALTVRVQNIGQVQWYGYQTGSSSGITQVRVQLASAGDPETVLGDPTYLYVSGFAQPGERAQAVGRFRAPKQPGDYLLQLDVTVAKLGVLPTSAQHPVYLVPLKVKARSST